MDSKQYNTYHEKKSHTEPDFPYNTYLCTIPFDFPSVSIHWHNEAEIIAVKKGTGIVNVNFSSYKVNEGEYVFILPGQLHSISQFENSKMEYENIIFEKNFVANSNDITSHIILSILSGEYDTNTIIDQSVSYYKEFDNIIKYIDNLCSKKSAGYQVAVKGKIFELFYLLISNHKKTESTRNNTEYEKIKKIFDYICENYAEKISVKNAADICCYSSSYFMKFFKQTTGMGFIEYLNSYRLETAAQMLSASNDNILDIAEKTGFENLSYFNRSFKKKFGLTPGQYRKKIKR